MGGRGGGRGVVGSPIGGEVTDGGGGVWSGRGMVGVCKGDTGEMEYGSGDGPVIVIGGGGKGGYRSSGA